MNTLTAVFLDVLGSETGQAQRAAELTKKNMRAEFEKRTGELLLSSTVFFSDEGKCLKQKLCMLKKQIESINGARQAVEINRELSSLYVEAEKLHRETQRQIHKRGHIDVRKLHFFYQKEQSDALDILENYNRAELYRIAVLSGGQSFLTRKPLACFSHSIQDSLRYLKEEIVPVTDAVQFRKLENGLYWAAQHTDLMRAGPLGSLPGFTMIDPIKTDHRFYPGEHAVLPYRKGIVLQGIGYLTNLLPENVEKAQGRGCLITKISPDNLMPYIDYLQNPDVLLEHLFGERYYLISAEEYFAAASYAEVSYTILRRARIGQCLYCGKPASRGKFCDTCVKRIKLV